MKKQTFGIVITTRSFFPSHLVTAAREQITKLILNKGYDYILLNESDTEYGAVRTYDEAKKCAELFRKNADIISGVIIVLPNFGEETGVADCLDLAGLQVPVLVQACDDDFDALDLGHRRDAFCGKLSLCNNLYQRGIKFTNTTLHTCRIDSDIFAADFDRFAAICRVVKGIKHMRIAALGARPVAFNTVRYSEKILQKHQINVQTIDMSEVIAAANQIENDERVDSKMREIEEYGSIACGISREKIRTQAKLCIAIEQFIREYQCDCSAIQCWDSIQNNYGCATCLSMSMMGEKGLPSACEMDVTGALTMFAFLKATGTPPAYMDWNNNVNDERNMCITLHCSNFPKSFFQRESIEIGNLDVLATTIGEDKCFGACKAQVAEGPMTFAKISTDDANGTLKLYVGEGEFLPDAIDTKGGTALCHIDGLQSLMQYLCENGFEHHVAFVRGHVADVIEEAFGKYIGAEVYRHHIS